MKARNKLLVSLSKCYITFVLILLSIFVISYLVLGYRLSNSLKNEGIPIYDMVNGELKDINKIKYEDINNIGGFIEVLDSNRNVIKTIGNIKSDKKAYTEKELLQAIANDGRNKYTVMVKLSNYKDEKVTVLVWLPKNKISYEFKLLRAPYSIGKYFYKEYVKVIGTAILIGIVSIIIYSIWTARKIKKPLKKIDEALLKIIDGEYNEKLNLDDEVEFVVISDTINFLVDKLRRSEEENKRLQDSKSKMLMDLSHDIKTPITTIRGFSAALYSGLVTEDTQVERYYKTIYKESERVGELVDDLFDFVKLDNNNYAMNKEEVDLAEFFRQIIVEYIDELEENQFQVEINIPEKIVLINIDKRMIKRAITNLIENAIKYNKKGTKIRFELRNIGRFAVIEVADNGVGIDESVRDKIFDAFVRGDESRRSDGGSGLGLSIAQKIIQGHGGEIKLLMPSCGEKTIFYIKLYNNIS